MKRIAIVTPYGAEERLDNYAEFVLAQELIERGYDVRMFTYTSRALEYKDEVYKGVPVTRCRERHAFSPRLFSNLLWFRPDIVLALHPRSMLNFSAYWGARAVGARFIVEIVGILHDPFLVKDTDNPYGSEYEKPLLVTTLSQFLKQTVRGKLRNAWKNYVWHMPTAAADTVISINDEEKRYVQRFYGRDSVRIYWCAPRADTTSTIKQGVVPEKFIFFIGQMKRRKGWDTALEAVAELVRQGEEARMVIVGPQHTQESERYAKELGIADRLTFFSAISNQEKNWLYAHAECVLVPSRYEGFGLPIFEAFVAGAPGCASDLSIFTEFLREGENALLFKKGDGADAARALRTLRADPALRERLITEGIKTAEHFSRERMVGDYIQLFDSKI